MLPTQVEIGDSEIIRGKLAIFDSWSASIYLGITLQTLGRYRKEKWLKHYRIGNTILYLKNDLDKCRSIHPNQEKKGQHTEYITQGGL